MWRKTIIACETQKISLSIKEWSRRGSPLVMVHGLGDASCIWNYLAIRTRAAVPRGGDRPARARGFRLGSRSQIRYRNVRRGFNQSCRCAWLRPDDPDWSFLGSGRGDPLRRRSPRARSRFDHRRFRTRNSRKMGLTRSCGTLRQGRKVLRLSKNIQNGSQSGVRWLTRPCCDSSRANACAGPARMVGRRRPMLRSRTVRKSAGSSPAMGAIATRNCGRCLLRSVARPWSSEEAVRECCLSTWRPGWSSARFGTVSLRPSPQDTP